MTTLSEELQPVTRTFACSACGTEFDCSLTGQCWCAEETARLPMPSAGEDCFCRDCLRKMAAQAVTKA